MREVTEETEHKFHAEKNFEKKRRNKIIIWATWNN
jgi:hypothetical protein